MAICERVLRVRMEVRDAVAAKLREVTPDKLEQFELLLQDQRSVRKLADETLNDENVVTTENAERLFEAMRQATIEEERQEYERKLQLEQSRHREAQRKVRAEARQLAAERDAAQAAIAERAAIDQAKVDELIQKTSKHAKWIERIGTLVLLFMGALAILQYFTGWLTTSRIWTGTLAIAGLIGLYDFITNRLELPKVGIPTLLSLYCRWSLQRSLTLAGIPNISSKDFEFKGCKITRKDQKKARDLP